MSVTMLVMLVIQYGLGIILNLYVEVPASDAHAGILTEIATAPPVLTVHAVLGVALIGTAILLVGTAAQVRDRLLAVLATAGLTTLGGAFGAGEIFVRSGQDTASMAMAILTGLALLCYIGTLTLATAAGREVGGTRPVPVRAPVRAPVPAARPADRAHYPAAWPDSPGETTGSWFIRE
jgi:cytochrome bd-type quinol oxidase subunit 2